MSNNRGRDEPADLVGYVEQSLAPTQQNGDIVFMDNLHTHKVAGVREANEPAGAQLRGLPAYSPDLNSIELAFPKLKTVLRKSASRDINTLTKLIRKLLKTYAPEQCAN